MKSLTNKLVMSVLALVLTGVALSVGVLAWFTINNRATIEAFTGTVQTGEGFYVSLDGTTWKNTLTTTEMQTAAGAVTFVPLTSQDGIALYDLGSSTAATAGFIEFDLLFAGSANLNNIIIDSLTLSGTQTSWIPGIYVPGTRQTGAPDANTPILDYVSNAARVSFQDMITTTTSTIFEQSVGTDTNSLGFGTYATNEAILFYNAIMDTDLVENDFDTAAAALALKPTEQAGNGLTVVVAALNPNGTVISGYTYDTSSLTAIGGSSAKVGAITVRVWVEGWDQEAFNAILSGVLTVNFNFTATA
ncbi:hypothetical protein [Acholeplasma laidlawii]|uniref:Hypothetical surface-anchored protein n=1 Tax=Acholeplasma laidlawii (strain PG-8A) TaxID=441768 RepID=A9NGZ1_ACHLI|nr:hypothetical protein [Acholeplasma laidlawii]ABX81621.1 hypothetical surface-anchored protein [Acholeplasma laidlawii PG-8A]RED20703.1 hypothetical protein C7385_0941 [Acholeplasma laidlawii]SQH57216.1 Uncharacterised protein [Acholeplasma laidlawii]